MRIFNYKWICSLLLLVSFLALAQEARVGDGYALVIIDMQPGFVTRGGHDKDPENVKKVQTIIANQKQMIELAKKQNIPIVFIEYEGFKDTNSELKKSAEGYAGTKTFIKNTDGMFESYNKNVKPLSDYFRSEEIGNLIITGANGGACVEGSIEGALKNNYNVLAYNAGIADFNYENFIFPYDYADGAFKPTCESCTFKEYADYATLSLAVTTKMAKGTPSKPAPPNVDDSGRTVKKEDVVKKPKVKAKSPRTQAITQ